MIETFEAGGVLRLVDEFTTPLDRIIGKIDVFGAKLTETQEKIAALTFTPFLDKTKVEMESLGRIINTAAGDAVKAFGTSFDAIVQDAGRVSSGVIESFDKMRLGINEKFAAGGLDAAPMFASIPMAAEAAVAKAATTLSGLSTSVNAQVAAIGEGMAAKSAAALAATEIAPDNGRARLAHRSSGGLHFGRVGGEVGGMHLSTTGTPVLAAAGVALDAVYEMTQIDDFVAKSLMTSQIPVGPGVSNSEAGKRIHDMIQNMSKTTAFSFHDSGEAILEGQRLLSQMPFGVRNDLLERIIPNAAYEAKMKGSTLPEAVEAIIGIAHQTQTYDPAGIEKIAKSLAYTSLLTPSPLPQFQTALGYSMPELHNGLDMDPSTLMLLTATMQQSGIKGTRSGTWLRSFFENSEPGSDKHNEALRALGMLDANNKPTWRMTGLDGKVDWEASVGRLSEILQHDQETIPIDKRIGLLREGYGERGAGFASLMMGRRFTENLASAEAGMKTFKGGEDSLAQYANASLYQQGALALQNFNVAMSDLGAYLMPGATGAVKEFSEIVKAMDTDGLAGFGKLFADHAFKSTTQGVDPIAAASTAARAALKDEIKNGLPKALDDSLRPNLPIETFMEKSWRLQHPGQALPPGFHKTAFEDAVGGSYSNDNDAIAMLAQGVFQGLKLYAGGSGADPAGTAGSGFTNAAYTTYGDVVARAHPSIRYGRQHSGAAGANPYAGGVGGGAFVAPSGMALTAGMRQNNLGNLGFFPGMHYAGLLGPSNARDVDHSIAKFATMDDGIRAAASLALSKYNHGRHDAWDLIAAAGGWTPGALGPGASVNIARAMGLTNRDDLRLNDPDQMVKFLHGLAIQEHGAAGRFFTEDRIRGALHRPTAATTPPPVQTHIHNIHLDGKIIARAVTKHQVASMRMPTTYGDMDAHGTHASHATPLPDVA